MDAHELFNEGMELRKARRWGEALEAFQKAVAARPDNAEAQYFLGLSLSELGRLEEAVAAYGRAVALAPGMAKAYSNMGGTLNRLGRGDEAAAASRRAIELEPNLAEAHNNLGNALNLSGRVAEGAECMRRAAILAPQRSFFASNYLYCLYFHPRCPLPLLLREHAMWNHLYAEPLGKEVRPHQNDRRPDRRLRVAYVSPNLYSHAEAAFILPLLANHDHQRVEVFCYTDLLNADAITTRLRACADHWIATYDMTDAELAARMRADGIDILVDLTLHMGGSRLQAFARKPAPIQIAYLAYPGTTGVWAMDYRLTDAFVDPPGEHDGHYTEKSVRLPRTFACYDPAGVDVSPAESLDYSPMGRRLTFGCLNNFCKINEGVLDLWGAVLRAAPGSQLRLLAPSAEGRRFVLNHLGRLGIAGERIDFVGKQSRRAYMSEYRRIDVCLDTLPYNGHTTSLDALWMGVPVVTRVGPTAAGRVGWSVLNNLQLPELAAWDDGQFVRIAVELANDTPRLADLRRTLRDRLKASPIMDGAGFAQDVEAAYRKMWLTWLTEAAKRDEV
jgi:protein O-GlcNAc transferase